TLSVASYRFLHRELLAACTTQIALVDVGLASLLRRMVDLAQPWLTLETLAATDSETIASLHHQCQGINEILGVRSGLRWAYLALILVFVIVASLGAYMLTINTISVQPLITWVRRNPVVSLIGLAPVALLVAVFMLKRILRAPRS